jgi:hypothetical protein
VGSVPWCPHVPLGGDAYVSIVTLLKFKCKLREIMLVSGFDRNQCEAPTIIRLGLWESQVVCQ